MKNFLPKKAENSYSFPKSVVIIFMIVTIITLGRSLAHIFLPDGGANSIATIIQFDGNPDPDRVIYFIFSLWGLAQLSMGILYVIVLIRYKNLIPLMWLFILFEYTTRIVIQKLIKPMDGGFTQGTAPGEIGNYIVIPIAVVMIVLSLLLPKKSKDKCDR